MGSSDLLICDGVPSVIINGEHHVEAEQVHQLHKKPRCKALLQVRCCGLPLDQSTSHDRCRPMQCLHGAKHGCMNVSDAACLLYSCKHEVSASASVLF